MKKLIKIIIPLFIMFICTNVSAVTITTDQTKPGTTDPDSYYVTNNATLKISGSYNDMGVYKILDTYYNSTTNVFTYEFTEEFKTFLNQSSTYKDLTVEEYYQLTSGDITSGSTLTTSTLDKLMSLYTEYIRKNSIEGIYLFNSSEFVAGSYLIIPESTMHDYIYAVMVGNIVFESNGADWILNDAEIVAKRAKVAGSFWIYNFNYKDKTFIIGREFEYISDLLVPNYPTNATNKSFIVENAFDKGITFQGFNKLTMTIGENKYTPDATGTIKDLDGNTIATLTFIDQVLTINFNTDYIFIDRVIIRYKAMLNNNAAIGPDGNNVTQNISYASDPYGTTNSVFSRHTATAYTYDLALLKYDADDENILLNGAVFEIYTDEELTDLVGTVTTGTLEDEVGVFHGLAQGTYYIIEKKAPSGYKLIKDVIVYELDTGQDEKIEIPMALPYPPLKGTYLFEIANEKISFLPVTGGIGTVIYTLTGLIIVGGAFYYIKKQNKKQTNM